MNLLYHIGWVDSVIVIYIVMGGSKSAIFALHNMYVTLFCSD